jgi:hypothetical protein
MTLLNFLFADNPLVIQKREQRGSTSDSPCYRRLAPRFEANKHPSFARMFQKDWHFGMLQSAENRQLKMAGCAVSRGVGCEIGSQRPGGLDWNENTSWSVALVS